MALLLGSSAACLTFAAEDKRPAFGEPRAEATEADRKIFTDGLKQFSRAWDAHDGVGARFNEHSCTGCHSVPVAGGSGTAVNTFVVVSKDISDAGGGHVFQRFQRTADGIVEIAVEDRGPGLPPGRERALFDKFTRGARESATSGVGLGLAISRAIVLAHKGSIWAEPRSDRGACFRFTLPLGTPPALPAADAGSHENEDVAPAASARS